MNKAQQQVSIKQLKEQLDQLLSEVDSAPPEDIEQSALKLKQAKQIIADIEKRLKFSEVQINEL